MSDWVRLTQEQADKLTSQTTAQAENLHASPKKRHGRSLKTMNDHSRRGLISEMLENQPDEAWRQAQWEKAQLKGDDGGVDTRDRKQLKSIDFNRPPSHVRVFVSYPSDYRASYFKVWEIDMPNLRGRVAGYFLKEDIQTFPDGYSGVYIRDLRQV